MQSIAEYCIKTIKETLYISYEKDLLLDPCAENGGTLFLGQTESLARLSLFCDPKPLRAEIKEADLLSIDFNYFDKTTLAGLWYNAIHVISFPPPHLIEKFIDATCKFAQSVSFLSTENPKPNICPPNFFLIHQEKIILNKTSYYFHIWIKADL